MTRFGSIARFAALGALCILGTAARAEVPANGPGYMDAAFASVDTLIKASQGKPTLPRLADPVEGKVLEDVWNEAAILGKAPYAEADIPALLAIVQKQTLILKAYTLFSPDRKAPDTARNTVEFQDELTRTHVFLLKAVAASLEAINSFGAHLKVEEKTEARFQGIRQMRLGLQEIVAGAALALRIPALRPANQLLIARSLAENAAALAAGTAPPDRQALIAALQAAQPALKPDAKKAISEFIQTVSAASCDGLCRLN
ncbi:hypothetical protein [Bosea sp. NBC_00550]|jgi:hypothetical protein|uniref:hypothetical protein n=1 Tax=Bosea sp. NBC_00550 TaxID=2969621 RepID=UPI0022316950|nr:hypothetical protein [Bosea sp. NBC_00550]UZF92889.1 hypothetical protein NWE53_01300 [Bosea sp. NBC_00550]HVK90474.1 hypothetical protein [Mycoplana sp.]